VLEAHNLSGLKVILEVTDETDRVDAGDPEDAIWRGLWRMDTAPFDKGGNGGFSGRVVSQKKSLGRVPIRRSRY